MNRWMQRCGLLAFVLGLAGAAVAQNEEPAANVKAVVQLVSDGDIKVVTANGTTAASEKMALYGDDRIIVGTGAWTIVRLKNNYLVRLDEEIDLTVNQIVLIDQPPTDKTVEEQLKQLLSEQEIRQSLAGKPASERLAGWYVRRAAGDAQPVATAGPTAAAGAPAPPTSSDEEVAAAPPPAREEPEPEGILAWIFGSKKKAPAAPPAQPQAIERADKTGSKGLMPSPASPPGTSAVASPELQPAPALASAGGKGQEKVEEATPSEPKKPAAISATEKKTTVKRKRSPINIASTEGDQESQLTTKARTAEAAPLSKLTKRLQQDSKFMKCLGTAVKQQGVDPDKVVLRIKVKGGQIVTMGLDGGLRMPACPLEKYRGKSIPDAVDDGWYKIEILRKK